MKSKIFALGLFCGALALLSPNLSAVWQPAETISTPGIISPLGGPVLSVNCAGNATAVWTDRDPDIGRVISSNFYDRNVGWQEPIIISSLEMNSSDKDLYTAQGDPDVAMNSSNYAVAVWEGEYSEEPNYPQVIISAVRQSNGVWDPVQLVSEDSNRLAATNANVAINDAGTAVVAFRSYDRILNEQYIKVSILTPGGTWSAPLIISDVEEPSGLTPDSKPYVVINESGDIAVIWYRRYPQNVYGIDVATYDAGTATWSPPVHLDTGNSNDFDQNPRVAIDENGNAVAIWNFNGDVKTSFFTAGTGWGPSQVIGFLADRNPSVVMDPAGNATATWATNYPQGQIYSAFKPIGGVWTVAEIISNGTNNTQYPFMSQEALAVDSEGNVIAIWDAGDGMLASAFRLFNQPWQSPLTVTVVPEGSIYESVGLACCGFAVALWSNGDEARAAVNENLISFIESGSASFTHCKLQFATQKTYISSLSWVPVSPACISAYNIYCNGRLVATTMDTSVSIQSCDKVPCNFTLTTVVSGLESPPIPFVLRN
ncbi:MAG TPA: hypothetical protein VGP47_03335 [Parachlamydiaceae bacterium]|nr:hypothetical protein [Parachlamydiaceae bacterium]